MSTHVSSDLAAALLLGEMGSLVTSPSQLTTEVPRAAAPSKRRHDDLIPLLPGERVGRFVVEELVGAGGMGVVVAATDSTLHRRVAIKVLQDHYAEDARFRLLREARAMASIEHPNVVNVFEAGEHEGSVYIAMELIDGLDARGWLDQATRSWSDVLEVWIAAGRGLAAAHARGLVHRDFKPHNMLISKDGRVLVTDFGLVSACGASVTEGAPRPTPWLDEAMTAAGAVVGTPRYMAPEQANGDRTAPASDQYAFCVSLFEALMGQLPGEAGDPNRARAKLPSSRRPPRRLLQSIARGYRRDPDHRYPDMPALLQTLEAIASAGQRRRRLGGAALALGASLALGAMLPSGYEEQRCPAPSGDLPDVWDDATRSRIRDAVRSAATWTRLESSVDRYVATWGHMAEQACRATHERGEVSEALFDRRMACLSRGRSALAETLELVASGGADREALELLYELPDLSACEDLEGLATAEPHPTDPKAVAAIEQAERVHVRARSLVVQGRFDEAVATVDSVLDSVEWAPLAATLLGTQAEALFATDPSAARPVWQGAYELATESGDTRQLLDLEMVRVDGAVDAFDVETAELWLGVAEARARRVGDGGTTIDLMRLRGDVERIAGRSAAAEASYRDALAQAEATGERHEDLDVLHGDIGGMAYERGEYTMAFHHTDLAIEAATRVFGATHLRTLRWKVNRTIIGWSRGDRAGAEEQLRQVLADAGDRAGHTGALLGLAMVLRREGRLDEAIEIDRALVEDRTRRYGAGAAPTAEARGKYALDLHGRGDLEQADVALSEAVFGLDHAEPLSLLVELCADLAMVRLEAGDVRGARAAIDRGETELERLPGPSRVSMRFFDQKGRLLLAEGRAPAAEETFRRGLEIAHRRGATPQRAQAALRFALARAMWANGKHEAAQGEAEHAADVLAGLQQSDSALGHRIEDWLTSVAGA